MRSWTEPTPELVEHALASTVDVEQRRYFFNKLLNPLWVKPLAERKFFVNPPEPMKTGDGGLQIPFWPESQYLARVASEVPEEVVGVASKIQTDNPRVLEDLLDIALAVENPKLSKHFSGHGSAFVGNPFARLYYRKLGRLVLHWAKLGLRKEALELAELIVSFLPDPREAEKEQRRKNNPDDFSVGMDSRPEPRLRCDHHVYEKILNENILRLAELFPRETVKLLTQALSEGISWSLSEPEKGDFFDGSDFWCRHLKRKGEYEDNPKGVLARVLLRSCEILLQKEPSAFQELDGSLQTQRWYFFRRLRWFLYSEFPQLAKDAIRKETVAYKDYEDGEYGFEFASMLLASSQNELLSNDELELIFKRIASGPDIESFKQWIGDKVTEEDVRKRKGYFFTKQMFPFAPVLPRFPEYMKMYEGFTKEHGERALTDYFGVGEPTVLTMEEKSPLTVDSLLGKSNDDLLEFIRTWKPKAKHYDFESPNIPGLSKVFTEALKREPERFLNISNRMTLPPVFTRDFLYFVNELAKQKQPLPWQKLLELSEWIISQPFRTPEVRLENRADEVDVDFTECRHVLAGIFKYGSQNHAHSIQWELRSRVFAILEHLCCSYDSRLDQGPSFGRDLLTEAINSVRAEAVHALVDHAFWIKRHLKIESDAMKSMPEVAQVLEQRLDPSAEKSLAVVAVFGYLTPSLHYLDSQWRDSVHSRIFPPENEHRSRWDAAWVTYVSWNSANKPLFEHLEPEYWKAVSDLEEFRKEKSSENRAVEALGEHLIIFYGFGTIPLSGEHSLLAEFLKRATQKERAHVMNYVGRALENTLTLPEDIKQRLTLYWESRLTSAIMENNPKESSEELLEFAWWFNSRKCDNLWSFRQLKEMLGFVSTLPETLFLLEDLADMALEHPLETAQALELIVGKTTKDRYLYLDEEKVKHILRIAENSGIAEAVRLTHAIQDQLVRVGRFEYQNLEQKC